MSDIQTFGKWLRRRRREMDLTQSQLGALAGCAQITIQKLEADRLRPSRQLAEILLIKLGIPADERELYVQFARCGESTDDILKAAHKSSRNNLPTDLTSFIGRQQELQDVKRLLRIARLVTMTGAGGVGKSRLAMQVARSVLDDYLDGVWFVELAGLSDPDSLPLTVMIALGLRKTLDDDDQTLLVKYFQEKCLLLILDNCEHLLDACAHLVYTLLQHCSKITILATCREVLDVEGEVVYRLPSLTNLDPTRTGDLHLLTEIDSVRLFTERAQAILPDFHLTDQVLPAVARICYRLDGIPLAIELAAALISTLSAEQIADRLDDRFRLLIIGNRTALPRHRTLRASIDWSYNLLSEPQCYLLQRLSVYVGGWTLETIESTCAGDGLEKSAIIDALTGLVKKSLIYKVYKDESASFSNDPTRFRMVETIRQYVFEKLAENSDRIHARQRDWCLDLAERAEAILKGHDQVAWLRRLALEHDNLRAGLDWSLAKEEAEIALRLVAALGYYWAMRGYTDEYRQYRHKALAMADKVDELQNSSWKEKVLQGPILIFKNFYPNSPNPAYAEVEQALQIFQDLGDRPGVGSSYLVLSSLSLILGNVEVALHQAEASLAILQEENDEWGIANCLMQLKFIAEVKGEYTQSYALGEEGVRRIRTTGDRWCLSHHLNEHFWLVWDSGETNKARLLFEQNLEIIREFADRQGEARMLRILADLALYHGKIDRALAYLDECSPIELGLGNEGLIPWMILRARIALWQGNLSDAQSAYEAAQRSCQEVDSPYYHCLILEGMGLVKYYQGEYLLAERNLHEALLFADRARSQLMSNQTRRWIWRDLGDVSRQQDKLDDAMGWYRKSLGLMQWMGCQPFMPDTIEAIAKVAGILGQNQRAVRLFAASQAAREWLEIPVPAVSQPDYERNLRGIHKAMGEVTFNAAWEEGKKMTLEQALELAMEKPPD